LATINADASVHKMRANDGLREEFEKYHVPPPELQRLFDAHALWVHTDGREAAQLKDENAGFQFRGLMLDGFCLRGAKLHGVDFVSCSMVRIDLSNSDLESTVFNNCLLTSAKFRYANLTRVGITGCESNLDGADFLGAEVTGASIPTIRSCSALADAFPAFRR
jgi:uncharacterized protein YjbI with pentapeptide repeats